MNITHVVPYMHPHAGGPPVVVDRLSRRLVARGHRVRVLTTDATSEGERGWERAYADGGYELEVHRSRGGAFAYSRTFAASVRRAVAASDLVHLHTVWTYPTLRAAWACRRAGVPYVVMPHGMLDPQSVRRKWVKKWAYSWLVEGPNLRRASGMIYTHPEEELLARQTAAGLPPGWVMPLAADEPPATRHQLAAEFFAAYPNYRGSRIVLFLGRLHPKKGLDLLVPAFAEMARRMPEARLVLVGPGEDAYVSRLRSMVEGLDLGERVSFLGPLSGRRKWAAYAAACLFALPSYQENFALTVVEALSIGTPVLLSQNVNIWREVEKSGAGTITQLDTGILVDKLCELVGNSDSDLLGSLGPKFIHDTYTWDRTTDAGEAAYRAILAGGPDALAAEGSDRRDGAGK